LHGQRLPKAASPMPWGIREVRARAPLAWGIAQLVCMMRGTPPDVCNLSK